MGSSNNNRWNICVLLLEIELIASNSFPPFMWIFSPDHMADCLVVLVFLSMFCCNSFDKLYKLIRLCNRQARLCCFWQIMNNMCFWRVALIALVLNVVMKMMPNCVWHAVFELRTAILVMSHWYLYVDMNVETIWWVFMPAAADVTLKILRAPLQKKQPIYSLRVEKMNWIRDYAGRHC